MIEHKTFCIVLPLFSLDQAVKLAEDHVKQQLEEETPFSLKFDGMEVIKGRYHYNMQYKFVFSLKWVGYEDEEA